MSHRRTVEAKASRSTVDRTWASWGAVVVAMFVAVLSVWIVSPRFGIEGPSLVDDWAAISRSSDQVSDMLHLRDPEPERFRPSWIVWNYVQWNTFDAPNGLVGPNAWNIARLLVFVVGVTLLTALLLPRPSSRREALIHAGLAGLPALAVITVPKFARDFAWFGPQEPLLLGGLALGGSLLALTARDLLDPRPVPRLRVTLLGLGGSFFWLVGVYHKEVSLSALPLAAVVLVAGRGKLDGWHALTFRRRIALGSIAAVASLPLLHVAVETTRIALRGDLVYGAEVDGGKGVVQGLRVLYDWSHEAMPLNARYLMVGAVVLTLAAGAVRRRIDLVPVGALASGCLAIVFAAQSGVAVSRYYIPMYVLFALAFSLSLARLPELIQAAGLLVVFFAFMPPTEPHAEVQRWSDEERQHTAVIETVSGLETSGCNVAVDALDIETSIALPTLVELDQSDDPRPLSCSAPAYLVLPPYPSEQIPLVRACAPGSSKPVVLGRLLGVYACSTLSTRPVHDPSHGVLEPAKLIAAYRFASRGDP